MEQPMDNNDNNNICLLLLYNFEETGFSWLLSSEGSRITIVKKIKIKIKIWACDHKLID